MSEQTESTASSRIADLAVVVLLAALVALYCYDALQASRSIYNLILVLPVTVVVLLLCLIQLFVGLKVPPVNRQKAEPVADILPAVALFAAYILTLPWLGFDVGTFLFLAVFLRVHGERRVAWLLGYSISFASIVSLFFSLMLPYPMPLLILGSS